MRCVGCIWSVSFASNKAPTKSNLRVSKPYKHPFGTSTGNSQLSDKIPAMRSARGFRRVSTRYLSNERAIQPLYLNFSTKLTVPSPGFWPMGLMMAHQPVICLWPILARTWKLLFRPRRLPYQARSQSINLLAAITTSLKFVIKGVWHDKSTVGIINGAEEKPT